MVYVDFSAGNKDYKLRLNTRNTIALEKSMGCNPLSIFLKEDEIPTITTMVSILYFSLQQLNHGISLDDAYEIFDRYLDEGHTVVDFLKVIEQIYKVSGIIKDESNTSKN